MRLHVEREFAFVNETDISFGAGDGDRLSVANDSVAVFRSDDGGKPELATDDGGVAGAAAAIGHDGGGFFHDRFPIGIGLVGDQHFAFLKFGEMIGVLDHAHRAGRDLLRRHCVH